MVRPNKRFVSMWNPFTPSAVGIPEIEMHKIHNKPYVAALNYLSEISGKKCTSDYITDRIMPYKIRDLSVIWNFWPISMRTSRSSRLYRMQWSLLGALSLAYCRPDVVFFNMSGLGSPFNRLLGRICLLLRIPYVVIIGGQNVSYSSQQVQYFSGATCIVTHTTLQRQKMEAQLGVNFGCFNVMSLGIDTNLFCPGLKRNSSIGPNLLYVGRIMQVKGIEIAISALPYIKRYFPNVKLHLVGPFGDERYKRLLCEFIDRHALQENTEFHGLVPYQKLPKWYRDADLLLLPSQSESFGMVAVESMACGTPVVALRGSGAPEEIISHGFDGLLLEEDNFGSAIVELLDNRKRLFRMRREARQKIETSYSLDITKNKMLEIVYSSID